MINVYGIANDHWQEKGYRDDERFLLVHSCGYQKFLTRNHRVSRPGGRVDYQLIYLMSGRGYYELKEGPAEVQAGSFILFRPGEPQTFHYQAEDQTELYWVHFTGFGVPEMLRGMNTTRQILTQVDTADAYRSGFDEIIHELQMKRPAFQVQTAAVFMQILTAVCRVQTKAARQSPRQKRQEIDQALHLMHMNYQESWTLTRLAQAVNLSVYHFARQFKNSTGITPIQYLTRIRMNTARDLLSSTPLPVQEIAALTGYPNPLYFSRVFRQETGCCPTQYRKQT